MPSGFKKRCAPSRHSGLSSLSPKDPSSSDIYNERQHTTRTFNSELRKKRFFPPRLPAHTIMSAWHGACHCRMSPLTTVTVLDQPSVRIKFLKATTAFGFLSKAKTRIEMPQRVAAWSKSNMTFVRDNPLTTATKLKHVRDERQYLQSCTHNRAPASSHDHDNWQFLRLSQRAAAAAVPVAINQSSYCRILVKFIPDTGRDECDNRCESNCELRY